jgi:hypothetical protein
VRSLPGFAPWRLCPIGQSVRGAGGWRGSEGSPDTRARNRVRIVSFAPEARVRAIYGFRIFASEGGLLSYGVNIPDQFRRGADFVDKILRGTKPSDMPAGRATHQIRSRRQPAGSQGARPHHSGNAAGHRRRGDPVRRREFIAGFGSAAAWPVVAQTQGQRVRRIGVLMGG